MAHIPQECTCARSLKYSICYHEICCSVAHSKHVEQGPCGLQTFAEFFWEKGMHNFQHLEKTAKKVNASNKL